LFTMKIFMTDSDFNPINALDVVFTPADKLQTSYKLTATNPGTYYYNLIFTNNGPTISSLKIYVTIPNDFVLKPIATGQPVQIDGAPVSGYTLIGGMLTVPVGTVNNGQFFTLTVHLDYALKGSTPYPKDSQTSYRKEYSFTTKMDVDVDLVPCSGIAARAPTLVATGKRVTAIGGFVTDLNSYPKNGLTVKITDPVGGVKTLTTGNVMGDGFYFLPVSAGKGYMVQLYNSANNQVGIQTNIEVVQDAFVQVDFNTLSPADPAIHGFVKDKAGNAVAGVTVQLIDVSGRVVATTKTNLGGYYIFRFSRPGSYTIKIIVPTGYIAATTSVNLTVKQFETATVNFTLTKT